MQLMKNPNQKSTTGCLLAALSASFLLQSTAVAVSQGLAQPALDGSNRGRAFIQKHVQPSDAAVQFELGRKSEFGIDTRANPRAAAHWYRLAADQGLARAEYSLGRLYSTGDGVLQDQAEAVRYFRRAAAKGYGLAQHRLARAYELGQGRPRDLVEAHRWYTLAANENGFASSRLNLKKLEARMNEAQLAQVRVPSPKFPAIVNASKGE